MQELEEASGAEGRKDILPIKNLTAPTPEAGVLVCRALKEALCPAVDYLKECVDMGASCKDAELV